MKIGYRRWSRPIGTSPDEKFSISGWFEKRLAFLKLLEDRGHSVEMLSGLTKESAQAFGQSVFKFPAEELDLLFIEMSNENVLQNYKVIAESMGIMNTVKCPIILLWDDPAITLKIRQPQELPKIKMEKMNFTVFINAEAELGDVDWPSFFAPEVRENIGTVKFEFFPFGALLTQLEIADNPEKDSLVYIGGHGGGRLKDLEIIRAQLPLEIFYKQTSYPYELHGEAPRQPERLNFYRKYMCNLGLQDSTHKRLKWHTGRCFHALAAGIPSLVDKNSVLAKYFTPCDFDRTNDGYDYVRTVRRQAVENSRRALTGLNQIINLTLEKYGL